MDVIDIASYLQKKRVQNALTGAGLPQQDAVAGVTGTIGNSLYETPESLNDYRDKIANQPDFQHPGKARSILGKIAGIGMGVATSDPEKAQKAEYNVSYAPSIRAANEYAPQLAKAKSIADIDSSIQDQLQKGQVQYATVGHLNAQSEAEKSRRDAEASRARAQEATRKKTEVETAPDHATFVQEDLNRINAQHPKTPKGFDVKLDPNNGRYFLLNQDTGDLSVETYATPEEAAEKLTGELKSRLDAETILANPQASPVAKKAAQGYLNALRERVTPNPPQPTVVFAPGPDGQIRRQDIPAGGVVPPGAMSPTQAGSLNAPTNTTRTMIEAAPKVKGLISRVRQLVDQNVKELGPVVGRWNEFITGKAGAPNPSFAALRADMGLLNTLIMRMHVGARGGIQMAQSFQDKLGTASQDPNNLKAILDEIDAYADLVAGESGHGDGASESGVVKLVRGPDGKLREVTQ